MADPLQWVKRLSRASSIDNFVYCSPWVFGSVSFVQMIRRAYFAWLRISSDSPESKRTEQCSGMRTPDIDEVLNETRCSLDFENSPKQRIGLKQFHCPELCLWCKWTSPLLIHQGASRTLRSENHSKRIARGESPESPKEHRKPAASALHRFTSRF